MMLAVKKNQLCAALAVALVALACLALPGLSARAATEVPSDGSYTVDVQMQGGTGRASVDSPTTLEVQDGRMTATVTWSSPYYDLMIVDGTNYLPTNETGNSAFQIPVAALDEDLAVQAETTAMSRPHTIDYTLRFSNPRRPGSNAVLVAGVAVAVIVAAVVAVALLRRCKRRVGGEAA